MRRDSPSCRESVWRDVDQIKSTSPALCNVDALKGWAESMEFVKFALVIKIPTHKPKYAKDAQPIKSYLMDNVSVLQDLVSMLIVNVLIVKIVDFSYWMVSVLVVPFREYLMEQIVFVLQDLCKLMVCAPSNVRKINW